jgi:hypothetical protein
MSFDWRTGRYHWSNTALEAQFWKIPASTSIPWLVCLFYPRMNTLYFALIFTIVLTVLQWKFKMTPLDACRRIRVLITGRVKNTKKLL